MGLSPASYQVTARSVSRVLGDGRRQSDRSLKGHEAGVRKGQPWAVNHHPGIVAVYGLTACPAARQLGPAADSDCPQAEAAKARSGRERVLPSYHGNRMI